MRTNASDTARDSMGSIVKRSRLQSAEMARCFSCSVMRLPYVSFHFHTSDTNASRPRSCRLTPRSFARRFSTTACVAIPAWSVPGTHSVGLPIMRFQRVMQSSTAAVSAWPRCSDPVTLGGGITMTKRPPSPAALAASGCPL